MQPRWVHMPITTSHWSWPALTRASSGCGSGRLLTGTARASSISFLVRWLMKIGLPRQNTLMICPSAMGPRSTSIGAPAAMRSEERRVGKECRSLCDWSSDVCSSDLGAMADEDRLAAPEYLDDLPLGDGAEVDLDRRAGRDEIGRASCRERV